MYLSRPSLWQVRHDVDLLRGSKSSDDLTDLANKLLGQTSFVVWVTIEVPTKKVNKNHVSIVDNVPFEGDKCMHSLTGELVVGTDDRGLSNTRVEDECGLYFSGGETVRGDVDDVCKLDVRERIGRE